MNTDDRKTWLASNNFGLGLLGRKRSKRCRRSYTCFQEAQISPCLLWRGCLPATARWGVGAGGQQGACLFSCESARTAATASRRSTFRSRGHAAQNLVALNLEMLL